MAKNFRLNLPNASRSFSRSLPDYARVPSLPDVLLPDVAVEAPSLDFDPLDGVTVYPTTGMRNGYRLLNGGLLSLPLRNYRDHRQQYEASLIVRSLHPRKRYLRRSGNVFYFSLYDENEKTGDFYGEYWVNWDGIGNPWGVGGDKSNLTAGQYFITWAQWAVWFLVNDPSAQYFDPLPIPSLAPQWNALGVGWPWVNYVIPPELL